MTGVYLRYIQDILVLAPLLSRAKSSAEVMSTRSRTTSSTIASEVVGVVGQRGHVRLGSPSKGVGRRGPHIVGPTSDMPVFPQ